jgi:hypothetical protein
MTDDDKPLAKGALSRDPVADAAHADAYRARLAQQRAASKRYYAKKLSKRVRKDAEDEGEKAKLQSWRDELAQAREAYLAAQPGGVALPVDPVLSKLDALLARHDAAIGRVDARVAARTDGLAKAKADAEEGDLGTPLAETPGTTPKPSPVDPRHLDNPVEGAPFWHPEAES